MKIKSAEFVKSVSDGSLCKTFEKQQIAVVGRSNVGKSSFINTICSKKIAKTSSLPGRTRLINLFLINQRFYLVDLPGYGFAKASKLEQEKWGSLMDSYLKNSTDLKMVVLLVDIRHEPTDKDLQMCKYLYFYNIPFTVVATKHDKIPKSKAINYISIIASKLKIGVENIFPFSSENGFGKEKVLERFDQFMEEKQ